MFETLTKGFRSAKQKFQGLAELDEKTIDEALGDVRTSLLEADVGFEVVQEFCKQVREKALGVIVKVKATAKEKVRRVTPEDHFVKLCHDELVHLMGPVESDLRFAKKGPTGIMMVGLQGSGKTTTVGKLARYLEKQGRRPLLVAADVYRPAAIEQLKVLGETLGMPVYAEPGGSPPLICEKAQRYATEHGRDTVIFDTAGRLAIDELLMNELKEIKRRTNPANIFFVIDAMIGQDAVATAKTFHDWLNYDGVILTKLDGDARGVAMADGSHVDADVIIYGTGYQASKFLTPMQVTGQDGLDLHEQWAGDARAYLGVSIPGFPNFWCLYGPNTNIVINGSIIYFSECGVRFILGLVREVLAANAKAIVVKREVHDSFNEAVDAENRRMAWGWSPVNSWYKNEHGRVAQNWPFTLLDYWRRTKQVDPAEFELIG